MTFRKLLLATLASASILALTANFASAQQQLAPPRISVSATGTSSIAPDMAILNLAVLRQAKTAREALNANSEAMAQVLNAMKDAGVEERDLQTSNFNITPQYKYSRRSKTGEQAPPVIVGYNVSNSLTVRIRKLDDLGTILDQSVSLGVNNGGNGVNLGKIVLISEQNRGRPRPKAFARTARLESASDAVPIASGENSYSVTVNVTWDIEQ